jgi:dihydrofolate reductase
MTEENGAHMAEARLAEVSVALILARADNGVIGANGTLPWHIPADLQHFKRLTVGKPVIMGRKTFVSIGRPLPRRLNIVVTRDAAWTAPGVQVAASLPDAFALAYENALHTGAEEVMVIGGADIFRAGLALAQRIYLTEIHHDYAGDVTIDLPLGAGWRETSREDFAATAEGQPALSFVTLEKTLGEKT